MEVIAVGAIVVGGEDGLEIVAGAASDVAEEGPLSCRAAPAALDGNQGPVGQGEAADIHSVGVGVLAEAPVRPASDTAARIGRPRQFNPNHFLAKVPLGRWPHDVSFPKSQRRCGGTGGDDWTGIDVSGLGQFHRVLVAAATFAHIWNGLGLKTGSRQSRSAGPLVALKQRYLLGAQSGWQQIGLRRRRRTDQQHHHKQREGSQSRGGPNPGAFMLLI